MYMGVLPEINFTYLLYVQGCGVAIFEHSSLECITVDNFIKCVDYCADSL